MKWRPQHVTFNGDSANTELTKEYKHVLDHQAATAMR
jgi:hypothetical protein